MAQPDNFGFGEEAALLKESARKFFAENLPVDQLHALVAGNPDAARMSDCAWKPDLWQKMVELGWSMLAVPEETGGIGMPAVAVAGLVEELGRAAFPCPLIPTLNTSYVLKNCGTGGQGPLGDIAAGHSASLAITNSAGSWSTRKSEVNVQDNRLSGAAWFVQEARKVDFFLVAAGSESGISLFWVAADAPGLAIHPDAIVDLTRDQAHLVFDGVAAVPVCSDGSAALDAAMPAIWSIVAADVVGAAEWQLQTTVEYVSSRQQFDHPLGFFQAVKHPLVDVMVQVDQTKSLLYNAAAAIDAEPDIAHQAAHMAKASASETAAFASGRSVQCHGGIGFTWECFVQLYFKRQKHNQLLWGDAAWHRARLADILIGEVA